MVSHKENNTENELGTILADVYARAMPLMERALSEKAAEWQTMMNYPLHLQEAYAGLVANLMKQPEKMATLQAEYWANTTKLWQNTMARFQGNTEAPAVPADKLDKRFKSPEWHDNLLYDYIRQSYLLTREWTMKLVESAEGIDDHTRAKIDYATRQYLDAMAPSNFVLTNPDIIAETVRTRGENLLKGLENLVEDLERGQGMLRISTTDENAFIVGQNIATTKGAVVFRNEMMELIQYDATTPDVFKTPLMIVPPWINKYYILDLRPDNSFVKWLNDQGHTVFMISWVNPDGELRDVGFDGYLENGVLEATRQIETITGEKSVNAVGYCIGGTLLAITLAHLAAKKQSDTIKSATFLTTLLDFKHAGELKLFIDEAQIDFLESQMQERGYLDALYLQRTFSSLRANDLIWSFVVNNYLMGKEPSAFDLLYWNNDSTNLPMRMGCDYLRWMYLNNELIVPGRLVIGGTKIDLGEIKTPAYFLSTHDDHIAPWRATFAGPSLLGGETHFTLAKSGHIAGVVNPPAADKYGYWTNEGPADNPDRWLMNATDHAGSWWPNWQGWVERFTGEKTAARPIKSSLSPAPGDYVRKKL